MSGPIDQPNTCGSRRWVSAIDAYSGPDAPGIDLTDVRILVVSGEQPGARMAGPAIRAVNLTRQLKGLDADVVLACPQRPDQDLGLEVRPFGRPSYRQFHAIAQKADVVITQPQRVDVAAGLHRGRARIVYDCYVPSFVEYPASLLAAGPLDRSKKKLIERNQREYAAAIDSGDGFLVASELQKDFLFGALGQAGRLQNPPTAIAEAQPRVAVVPFGLPDERPPEPSDHAIKGVVAPDDAVVALWTGGIWNWFDPLTLLQGLHQARQKDPRICLVFMAAGHPSASFAGQTAAAVALRTPLARELIDSGAVVFIDKWVPHESRWGYLRDADLAVCAHFDSPETRMSFRTRFLDHLWAGLPTVTTSGGALSDLICEQGAGLCLAPGDPDEWERALLRLAGDPSERAAMAQAARSLSECFIWSRVTRPLAGLVQQLARGEAGPKRAPSIGKVASYLLVAAENRLR